ncbi:MAG: leucine-rich repeat domain-containing protein [Paludibacteraceae bacterium]|nr:leucine-rich repeat domain-containing protein [Paludibacteraceae bacterium]
MRRILLAISGLMLAVAAMAHDFDVDGIYYTVRSESELTVAVSFQGESYRDYPNEYAGTVAIPETVKYKNKNYSVVAIDNCAFGGCDNLNYVFIANSIRVIDDAAFVFCRHLQSVTCGNGVEVIGNDVFCGCEQLSSVSFGVSVRSIGTGVFAGCIGLEHLLISGGNTIYDARGGCDAIIETATNKLIAGCKNTIIPDDIVEISEAAFFGCNGLTAINIPASVTAIGFEAFAKCESLASIVVDPKNRIYDSRKNCNAIIETASGRLIAGCMNTVIPENVTSINASAFYGSSNLTSITIPASVTDIGNDAFGRCASLQNITVASANAVYDSRNGCNAIIETSRDRLVVGCAGTVVPNTVSQIGERAFFGCKKLKSLQIPNSVTEIGESAFEDCVGLSSVVIGDGVTSIGDVAFGRCEQLSSLRIGEGVVSIGQYAFSACFALKNVVIPNQVGFVGLCAFGGCENLNSVTIGSRVSFIGGGAFDGCVALTDVSCLAEDVIVEDDIFDDVNVSAATLHVSASAVKSYRKSSPWKQFGKIEALTN